MDNNVYWVDSHFHPQYDSLTEDCILDAKNNGISKLACVACNLNDMDILLKFKIKYGIKASLGVHPLEEDLNVDWKIMEDNIYLFDAVGETGFDYQSDLNLQLELFDIQAKLALKHNIPIILHIRDAGNGIVEDFTVKALKKYPDLKGVFHCFVGSQKLADYAINNNFFISFSGIITFKKCDELRKVLESVPLNLLMIETDAPWLAPVPLRGKINYPKYVKYIGEYIADYLNLTYEELSNQLLQNFDNLYGK